MIISLETLAEKINLTPGFCKNLSESAVACMDSQTHQSGVLMKVTTQGESFNTTIIWTTDITDSMLRTFRDAARTTDDGAMCLSLFLALNLTEYADFETSVTGTGIDFWLSRAGELNFSARLEISGIRKESESNTVEKRLATKKSQTKQSDKTQLPAYISIVEFSQPKALFIKK